MPIPFSSKNGNDQIARLKGISVLCMVIAMIVIALLFITVHQANMGSGPVDVLLVLGSPASIEGSITREEAWRVQEAVSEYRRGAASRVLFSGGAAANRFVEADVMAAFAIRSGLPKSAVLEERTSTTTVENLRNSADIMRKNAWTSVEIISTADHLRRVSALLKDAGFRWKVHPAPTPGRQLWREVTDYTEEAVATSMIRCVGPRAEPLIHATAGGLHALTFRLRLIKNRLRGCRDCI